MMASYPDILMLLAIYDCITAWLGLIVAMAAKGASIDAPKRWFLAMIRQNHVCCFGRDHDGR